MRCPKCGFDNYDGVLECCNCHNKLPQTNNYQQMQMQQPIMPEYMSRQQVLIDPNNLRMPKPKKNFKPLIATLFVIVLVAATGFCAWAFFASNEQRAKEEQLLSEIPIENEYIPNPEEKKESESSVLHIPMDEYVEPTPKIQTEIQDESTTIQEDTQLTEIEQLELDLFSETGYAIYGDANSAQIKVPANAQLGTPDIYSGSAITFWNGTKVLVSSINYEKSFLKSAYESYIEPYVEKWNFPEKREHLKTTMINDKIAYYADGYNEELDLYTRIYLIPNILAEMDETGTYKAVSGGGNKGGNFVMISVTYPSSDMSQATKLLKLITLECSTKYEDITLAERDELRKQELLGEDTIESQESAN